MPRQRKISKLFDPAALEATAKQMVRDGTMPSPQQLEAALDRIREKYAAEILQAREEDQMENSKNDSEENTGAEQQTLPTRRAGNTDLGLAKPGDPIYSEGWTITLGGLRGQSETPSDSTTAEESDSQSQDRQDKS